MRNRFAAQAGLSGENAKLVERQQKAGRRCGFCLCGDHAWTTLTRGYTTIFSPEDIEVVWSRLWFANVQRIANGIHVRARGWSPDGMPYLSRVILRIDGPIDHANQNPLDNRRSNLRPATPAQNIINRRVQNGEGYRGVCKDRRRWRAQISIGGKRHHLGLANSPEEAARLYDTAAARLHGEFAQLNFPKRAQNV